MIRKGLLLCLIVVLGSSLPLRAEGPSSRPSDGARQRGLGMGGPGMGGPGMGGGRGSGAPRGGAFDDGKEPTSEEIAQAMEFMKANFPNRFAMFEAIPTNRIFVRRGLTNRIVKQFRRLSEMKTQQPEMYEAMMSEQTLIDQAVGLLKDVRDGKDGAEDKLKAKIDEIVDNQLKERKARIEKLEKALAEQKEQLSKDEARKDELADQRREQLERDTKLPREKDDDKTDKSDKPDKPEGADAKPRQ